MCMSDILSQWEDLRMIKEKPLISHDELIEGVTLKLTGDLRQGAPIGGRQPACTDPSL